LEHDLWVGFWINAQLNQARGLVEVPTDIAKAGKNAP